MIILDGDVRGAGGLVEWAAGGDIVLGATEYAMGEKIDVEVRTSESCSLCTVRIRKACSGKTRASAQTPQLRWQKSAMSVPSGTPDIIVEMS